MVSCSFPFIQVNWFGETSCHFPLFVYVAVVVLFFTAGHLIYNSYKYGDIFHGLRG